MQMKVKDSYFLELNQRVSADGNKSDQ